MMVQVVGFQSDFFCIARVPFSVERSLGMLFGFSLIFLDEAQSQIPYIHFNTVDNFCF